MAVFQIQSFRCLQLNYSSTLTSSIPGYTSLIANSKLGLVVKSRKIKAKVRLSTLISFSKNPDQRTQEL